MFKVSFLVEDKKLAAVLHRLVGMGTGYPEVVPVAGAEPAPNGETKITATTKGTLDGFLAALKKSGAEINAVSAREAATKSGGSATAYSYYLKRAIVQGAIKKKGNGQHTTYEWKA